MRSVNARRNSDVNTFKILLTSKRENKGVVILSEKIQNKQKFYTFFSTNYL